MADSEFTAAKPEDILLSSDGRAVLRTSGTPVLTVYGATKWYSLVLVLKLQDKIYGSQPEFREVYFDELERAFVRGSPYVDHDPNPDAVRALARANHWFIDTLAEELIEGRWAMASRTTEDIAP